MRGNLTIPEVIEREPRGLSFPVCSETIVVGGGIGVEIENVEVSIEPIMVKYMSGVKNNS